jgi:CubicO group peptidase (beta-lactamase class C family)
VLLWSEPGRVWNYANYGTALAGLAMQRAAGAPFADVVEQTLFPAAGMTSASMRADAVAAAGGFACGHDGSGSTFGGPAVLSPMDSYYGAGWNGPRGGAWASARDLGAFASALLDDDADAPLAAVRAAATTARIRTDASPDVGYGLGLFVDASGTKQVWSHGGSVGGFLTDLQIVPETGVAIVLMVNSSDAFPQDTQAWALAELGGREWTWDGAAPPPIDDAAGAYVDDVVLGDVRVEAGPRIVIESLSIDAALDVYAEDTAVFFYDDWDMDMPVVFWRDEAGAVEYVSTMLGVARRAPP